MRITDLFKQTGLNKSINQSGSSDGSRAVAEREGEDGVKSGETAVRVSISPIAQQLSQVSALLNDEQAQRQLRVETLKAKIESGKYSVSSEDVARAMVSYSKDEA